MRPPFRTTDLDAAAFLRAKKLPLLSVERDTGRAVFHFTAEAADVVGGFYGGGSICAQDYASSLRELKRLLYSTNTNSSEAPRHDRIQCR